MFDDTYSIQDEHPSQSVMSYTTTGNFLYSDNNSICFNSDNKKVSVGDVFGIDLEHTLFRYPPIIDNYNVEFPLTQIEEDNIIDNLYIGDYRSSVNYPNYKLIINCDYPHNNVLKDTKRMDIIEVSTESHINETNNEKLFYIFGIGIEDSLEQNLLDIFDEVIELMKRFSDTKILIHCRAGISRSATFSIAYLMRYYNMSLQTAYEYVKAKRPKINPNENFIEQLRQYEAKLKK